MTEEFKNCPFCGKQIMQDAKKCKHCGKWVEPKTNDLPGCNKISTILFIILSVITLGIYQLYWIIKNSVTLNNIATDKDKINLIFPVAFVILNVISNIAYYCKDYLLMCELYIPLWILLIVTIYKMLRVIENYAYETTGKKIRHNRFFWWVFNILYANFAINSYADRISRAK